MVKVPYAYGMKETAQQMRHEMTAAQKHLWYDFLRQQPVQFKRQKPIERYIVDFYCPQAGLVIEVDGWIAELTEKQEAEKLQILTELGLKVLRFSEEEIRNSFSAVCWKIEDALLQAMG